MDTPRVVIITTTIKVGKELCSQLKQLLGEYINFDLFIYDETNIQFIDCDIVLVPTQKMAQKIIRFILPDTHIIVLRKTLQRKQLEQVMSIPFDTKVLLVNTHKSTAEQTATMLYELGVSHLQLIPYSPGDEINTTVDMALTPGEAHLVPEGISKIMDIGESVIDISTIFDMLSKLNMLNSRTKEILYSYIKITMSRSPGLISIMNSTVTHSEYFDLLVDIIDQGLIIYDNRGKVSIINKKATNIFTGYHRLFVGCDLKIFLVDGKLQDIYTNTVIKDKVFYINNSYYLVNKYSLTSKGKSIGGVIGFRETAKIESENKTVYRSLKNKGHIAKYSFEDILGESKQIKNIIDFARKMAITDHDILIEGESGTGKELLAQAIHNASIRRKEPFVAFNCASLNSTLLESELFGYEEGAFTGAKKGGKEGFFEMANGGTIFLDELGEISKAVQIKLLRVLQEREITRVGGTDIIPIDIRVIAATNKNLYSLVKENKFREDLFFRLNVINIRIPPLRERKGDIMFFIKHFINKNHMTRDIPGELMNILSKREWRGNIRELKNCIQYMISKSEDFNIDNLPEYIKDDILEKSEIHTKNNNKEELAVLSYLRDVDQRVNRPGRKEISLALKNKGFNLSEYEMRNLLKRMEEESLVKIVKGRGGTRITVQGLKMINGC